jgi:hypothetical protein
VFLSHYDERATISKKDKTINKHDRNHSLSLSLRFTTQVYGTRVRDISVSQFITAYNLLNRFHIILYARLTAHFIVYLPGTREYGKGTIIVARESRKAFSRLRWEEGRETKGGSK